MNAEKKQKIYSLVQDQLANASFRVKGYLLNEQGERRPRRDTFTDLQSYIDKFLNRESSVRWLTMYGLRGTGKTTLLAQLYEQLKIDNKQKLFLSVDQVVNTLGVRIQDVLEVYEEILGKPFEQLDEPVFLFLDEVQYDAKWGGVLKTVYDRAHNVFMVTTGSSALSLQANADVTRRTIFVESPPMSFMEYMRIKEGKAEDPELSKQLAEAIFASADARSAHGALKVLEPKVRAYWAGVSPQEVNQYMDVGTLPFMLPLSNEALVYDQISRTVERIISVDVPHVKRFTADTLAKFSAILYMVAESDQLSLTSVSKSIGISKPALTSVLKALERSEVLWRVMPNGSHAAQSRKPSKYLFTSPAFRAMYFNLVSSTRSRDTYRGKLLEDTIGLYLHKFFSGRPGVSITFDAASGGADFILRIGKQLLVLEAGVGEKSFKQLEATMGKHGVKAQYGIVVSQSELAMDEGKSAVSVPLQYFLLL